MTHRTIRARTVAGLALFLTALAGRAENVRVLAVHTPTPTPAPKVRVTAKHLAPAAAARLKAKGLDPASPNLKSSIAALAAGETRAAHAAPLLRTLPATRFSRVALSQALQGPGPGSGIERRSRVLRPTITNILGGSATNLRNTTSLTEGGAPSVVVVGDFDAYGDISTRVDLGPCGVVRLGGLAVFMKFFYPNAPPALANEPGFVTGGDYDALPNGQAGQLQLVVNGQVSNALAVTTGQAWKVTHAVDVTIAAAPPHFTPGGDTGLAASQMITPGGARVSTVPDVEGGTGGAGVDELGAGVFLMNGYTATAKIVRAHSFMDAPGYTAPSDIFRGAFIQQQPAAGRLLTKVAWSYAAGESVDYDIEWTLIGSPMKRALSSMPKPPCGD